MNILLVDDDAHVLEVIEKRMDWERLRIQERYTACNTVKARQILLNCPIDILLCDIEMPQETGLELLDWIRGQKLELQCILLTSYADFKYAQRALSLECLDYFLKPVDYKKLEEGLRRAVQKARDGRKYEFYEKNILDSRMNSGLVEFFWSSLLSGAVPPVRDEIEKEIRHRHLPYAADDYVAVCLMKIKTETENGQADQEAEEKKKASWKNHLAGLYNNWTPGGTNLLEAVICREKDWWILVIRQNRSDQTGQRLSPGLGDRMVKGIRQMEGVEDVYCGIGDWCTLDDFCVQTEELQELVRRGGSPSRVICQWDAQRREIAYCIPETECWERLLNEGDKNGLRGKVDGYLRRQDLEHGMNRHTLTQFRLDVTQLVYTFLRQNGIQAHIVFHNAENDKLYRGAVNSTAAMRLYTNYLLDKAFACKSLSEEPQSVIRQLVRYIDSHYHEELSREDLAAMVYLNPDYLSRKFKEEMKVSISGYIMNRRVEKARELLKNTDLPINAVALETGYDNFAYFARVFRARTGMSPNEYRKEWKNGKKEPIQT